MKVLVIRFSSIGDIVLTSPVVRALKKQLNAEVHFLTKSPFVSVVKDNPYIDKVHVLSSVFEKNLTELKKEKFDCIIDLHHNLRSLRFKKALNIPSYSFPKLNIEKWLMVNLKWDVLPKTHIVDRYFETCKSLGIVNDQEGLDYFISKEDEVDILTLPSQFQQGFIALAIGAQHSTKRMPLSMLEKFCKMSTSPIVILGGKDDEVNAWHLEKIDSNRIYNACGKYSLNGSASLLKHANTVVSNDTGLMHIASAFKKKVIAVWGNTIPEFGMYPYKTEHINFEVKNLSCRPCSKIGYAECPKKHFKCMEKQDLNSIVLEANK